MDPAHDSASGAADFGLDNPDLSRGERWIWFGLIALTFAVYLRVCGFDFVDYDDSDYVFNNPQVLSGFNQESVIWAFTTTHTGNWIPLTWLSLMVDAEFYADSPGGFHFTNVILHVANVLLLFAVFRRMTGAAWKSALVAGMFAVHPLHVETVAWVSERKDLLSSLFGLAAMYGYVRSVNAKSRYWFAASIVFFVCSLLSKQMLVTFPFVLLLLDFWPLQRFTVETLRKQLPALLWEKIPYFALMLIFCAVAYWAQQGGGNVHSFAEISPASRVANGVVAYTAYLQKAIWPNNLAVFYPHPGDGISTTTVVASATILLLVTAISLLQRRNHPYLLFGWLWFLGTLVPVIGLVQIGDQQMADRYTYVPIIGLFIGVIWWGASFSTDSPAPGWQKAIAVSAVIGYASVAWVQTGHWQNGVSLFQQTLEVTGGENFVAHYNLGNMLRHERRPLEAAEHYRRAMELRPNDSQPVHNLGVVLEQLGKSDEAASVYRRAIEINPNDAEAHNNLGAILHRQGLINNAVSHYREAIRSAPQNAEAYHNLAKAYEETNRIDESGKLYHKAIRLEPSNSQFHNSLGVFLIVRRKNLKMAITCFREAVRLAPHNSLAQDNLRYALEQSRGN